MCAYRPNPFAMSAQRTPCANLHLRYTNSSNTLVAINIYSDDMSSEQLNQLSSTGVCQSIIIHTSDSWRTWKANRLRCLRC